MSTIKDLIKNVPVLGGLAQKVYSKLIVNEAPKPTPIPFNGSAEYWETRYADGGNSGAGSYEKFAAFKAEVLNDFVRTHGVQTVIEFGCGDGNQLSLAEYPTYTGFDISATAVTICRNRFAGDPSKTFRRVDEYAGDKADLTLSLDVLYHLVEQEVFEKYMRTLFAASHHYVIIYSSNTDQNDGYKGTYVWHREFTRWIEENLAGWKLIRHIPNRYPYRGDYTEGSWADFFVYETIR